MIRWLLAGIALLTASAGQSAAGEREFAESMRERLRAAAPDIEARISAEDPLVIEMNDEGKGGDAKINLGRLHDFCAEATAEDCEAVLANFVSQITAPLPEPIAENLRVVVRQKAYLAQLLESQSDDAQPIYRQIGEDLYALLVFAAPNGVLMAVPKQLEQLGMADTAAWDLAGEQTREMLPRLPRPIDIVRGPVMVEDGELLSSLLVDLPAWRAIAEEVGPDLAVAATSDQLVLVAALPPDYRRMPELKRVLREDCASAERCISPNIYRFRDGRWTIAK